MTNIEIEQQIVAIRKASLEASKSPQAARQFLIDAGIIPDIDYRGLLWKYIRHVTECEGVDFISSGDCTTTNIVFTEEESYELHELSNRIQ